MANTTTIGEFVLDLVVDAGKGELTIQGLVASMGELEVASIGEIAILSELAKSLEKIVGDSIYTAKSLEHYTQATGASTEALQRWQAVAKHVGEEGSVANLFEYVAKSLERGQHIGGDFGALKNLVNFVHDVNLYTLDPSKPEKFFEALRKSRDFQNLPAIKKDVILEQSGLSGMLRSIEMAKGEFNEDYANAPVMLQKDIDAYIQISKDFASLELAADRIRLIISHWFAGVDGPLTSFTHAINRVADILDNRLAKTPKRDASTKRVLSSLEGSLMPEDKIYGYLGDFEESVFRRMLAGHLRGDTLGEGLANLPGDAYSGLSSGVSKIINMTPTYNVEINGTKLGPAELAKVVEDAFIRVNTEILNLVNRAAT